jgi:hypothetical protein
MEVSCDRSHSLRASTCREEIEVTATAVRKEVSSLFSAVTKTSDRVCGMSGSRKSSKVNVESGTATSLKEASRPAEATDRR